jgi:hypothetical protein
MEGVKINTRVQVEQNIEKDEDVPRSQGSSLVVHISPQRTAGAHLAWPAYLQCVWRTGSAQRDWLLGVSAKMMLMIRGCDGIMCSRLWIADANRVNHAVHVNNDRTAIIASHGKAYLLIQRDEALLVMKV